LQSSQLTKLLLANSAHEVRTPLNAIINYLEIALEGSLDQETRENLAKSHSASKSLIYVINDLLDLTKTEEGQDLIKDDVFDFYDTLHEATDSFRGDAKRRGLDFNVYEHPGLPQFVHGDQRRIRQVISNVIANAMQHTTTGSVRIETYLQDIMDNKATIEVVIQDTGVGMSDEKLDALFRDLEQLTTDEHGLDASDEPNRLTGGKQTRTLGLGLAMVARIVRTMDGQLRLKSEEGKGSRFVIQIPFLLPDDEDDGVSGQLGKRRLTSSNKSVASQPPRQTEGEVTLVEKNSSIKSGGDVSQKKSTEEINSLHSFKSASSNKTDKSVMSDVDRLIDAISTPFLGVEGETETEETTSLQRSNSKGSGPSRKSNSSWSNVPLKRNSFSAQDKPETLNRSRSYGTLQEHLRSPQEGPSGSEFVQDNKTLLRAVRMPDEFNERQTSEVQPHIASKVSFEIPPKVVSMPQAEIKPLDAEHLQVLVAEDDPVNSRIIKKRMEKSGHVVHRSNNGEECAAAYADNPALFDVVLMDMQVRRPLPYLFLF
jgi:CheY-like chemotaxis protein